MHVTPYLNFDGTCAEAFRFYAEVLRGEVEFMQSHGDSPIAGEVPAEWHDRIMHASLVAGDVRLMASDVPPDSYRSPQGIHVSLHVENIAEGERIFRALVEGGKVTMPFEKTFWAEGFGMLVDRYGIPWMVNVAGDQATSM
jgi:PhnB protein